MSKPTLNLVADIGGTNIRLGLVNNDGTTGDIRTYQCGEYDSLADVLRVYLDRHECAGKTVNACLAIACPVETDQITMTNLPWTFSQSALKHELNINQLFLINDYTAIAHAVPLLNDTQKVQIGEGDALSGKPISICGPGTGLGVANLVPTIDGWCCLGGEGGHVDFAPIDTNEIKILTYLLESKQHRISYEQLLCGKGLEQIYQAFLSIGNHPENYLSAEQISAKAIEGSCPLCEKSLTQFCNTLGSFAGNLALTLGSFGGVYIAGGIVPRFVSFIQNSDFRQRFDAKGRLSDFINNIPTYVITEAQPGLIGASAYIRQQLSFMKGQI
ncbi:MAG: glucokinase [Colwellia sp.]|nr:glucokinase [Colwellia sp.]